MRNNSARRSGIQIESLENRNLLSATPQLTPQLLHQSPLILETSQIGFVGDTAHFTGGNTDWTQAANLPVATISWGDHQSQTEHIAVFAIDSTTLGVGSYLAHFYSKAGTYRITTVLREGATIVGVSTNSVRVSRTTPGGLMLAANSGRTFNGVVGTLSTSVPLVVNSSSGAAPLTYLDWGDGSSVKLDPANIVALGHNKFKIRGTHTYGARGNFVIQVQAVYPSIEASKITQLLVSRIRVA